MTLGAVIADQSSMIGTERGSSRYTEKRRLIVNGHLYRSWQIPITGLCDFARGMQSGVVNTL